MIQSNAPVNYTQYLIDGGIHPDDAAEIGPTIHSHAELAMWIETYYENDQIHPLPERIAIGAPVIETRWKKNVQSLFKRMRESGAPVGVEPTWIRVANRRRIKAKIASLMVTFLMIWLTSQTMRFQIDADAPYGKTLYVAWTIMNAIMTWMMVSGFFTLIIGHIFATQGPEANPYHPTHAARDPDSNAKVAVIYPVYHEDAAAVAARLSAAWTTLKKHAGSDASLYDLFIISDSRKIEYWIAEQAAIHHLRILHPDANIFYRWRPSNHNAKLGNVVDFCRRWSNCYRYMWMMDADSLVDGSAIHTTLRMMEGNHRLGILQTNPKPILRTSLFGRMQQFTSHICGQPFSNAVSAMNMGHSSYIGHNAMIRMQPFVRHCMLPSLSGPSPWGGKPLSHDIIEAAMMARAGYEVWFLPDIQGSYEEIPSNLAGFLQRERRWMQGNLQHLRFLFLDGITAVHRETFFNGIMGYLASPIWSCFLLIGLNQATSFLISGRIAPEFITTVEMPAIFLLFATIIFILLPRLISVAVNLKSEKAKMFGGIDKIIYSSVIEFFYFFFISPVIMTFLTRFFIMWLRKNTVSWGTQQRDDTPITWKDSFRQFGWVSCIGTALTGYIFYKISCIPEQKIFVLDLMSNHHITPSCLLYWVSPLLIGMIFCPVFAKLPSHSSKIVRDIGLFCIPEEINEPEVVTKMNASLAYLRKNVPDSNDINKSIEYAVKNPFFFINHRKNTRFRKSVSNIIMPKILNNKSLTIRELSFALRERECFDAIHEKNF